MWRSADVALLVECLPSLLKILYKPSVWKYTCNPNSQNKEEEILEILDHPHLFSGIRPAWNIYIRPVLKNVYAKFFKIIILHILQQV